MQRNGRKVAKTTDAENTWKHSQFMSFTHLLKKHATISLIIIKTISRTLVQINCNKDIFFA